MEKLKTKSYYTKIYGGGSSDLIGKDTDFFKAYQL